jgi:hypothetical protein
LGSNWPVRELVAAPDGSAFVAESEKEQFEATGDLGRSDFVIHAQALRAMVTVTYGFKARGVRLAAKNQRPEQGQLPPCPCPFEFQCGPTADRLVPAPGVQWICNVEDDLPLTLASTYIRKGRSRPCRSAG